MIEPAKHDHRHSATLVRYGARKSVIGNETLIGAVCCEVITEDGTVDGIDSVAVLGNFFFWGGGPLSFGRQQRLSEITVEPINSTISYCVPVLFKLTATVIEMAK